MFFKPHITKSGFYLFCAFVQVAVMVACYEFGWSIYSYNFEVRTDLSWGLTVLKSVYIFGFTSLFQWSFSYILHSRFISALFVIHLGLLYLLIYISYYPYRSFFLLCCCVAGMIVASLLFRYLPSSNTDYDSDPDILDDDWS